MLNKISVALFFLIFTFSSVVKADLGYEVRGIERVSGMLGDAICVSLYITNETRKTYSFNLFSTNAKGDGLTSSPSIFTDKKPAFDPNQTLGAKSKARGWLCFDEPEYGWVPEVIEFSEVWGSKFLTVKVNTDN
ncbi:hypothetical protein N9403_01895 [Gammaproteobacteria bacterium]|nr:hypothetical protein [Gammaproteobacteria bacterium]